MDSPFLKHVKLPYLLNMRREYESWRCKFQIQSGTLPVYSCESSPLACNIRCNRSVSAEIQHMSVDELLTIRQAFMGYHAKLLRFFKKNDCSSLFESFYLPAFITRCQKKIKGGTIVQSEPRGKKDPYVCCPGVGSFW